MGAAISQAHACSAASLCRRPRRSANLASMSDEPPSLDELAKRFLDLWQDQIAAVAADPDMAHTLGRYAQIWAAMGPAGLAGIWAAAADGLAPDGMRGGNLNETGQAANVFAHGAFKDFFAQKPAAPTQAGAASAARGPAPAGAARDDRGDELAQLRRRVAELEARLAAEAAAPVAQKPRSARKRPGKPAPKAS